MLATVRGMRRLKKIAHIWSPFRSTIGANRRAASRNSGWISWDLDSERWSYSRNIQIDIFSPSLRYGGFRFDLTCKGAYSPATNRSAHTEQTERARIFSAVGTSERNAQNAHERTKHFPNHGGFLNECLFHSFKCALHSVAVKTCSFLSLHSPDHFFSCPTFWT